MSTLKIIKFPNLKGKTRSINDPYEVYRNEQAGWEWRVLKHYQAEDKEATNPLARVFCAVKSPYTMPGYDLGDTYISDISNYGTPVDLTKETLEKW